MGGVGGDWGGGCGGLGDIVLSNPANVGIK